MKDYGLVSIITASYNTARFIGATIEAIQRQTYQNWELLITDDCSPDNSNEIIERYASEDPRVKLLKLERNSGAAAARNNSIHHARGRYIAFCDSDDMWLPFKLERQLEFLDKKGVPMTYSSSLWCDEYGKIFGLTLAYRSVTYKQMCNCDKAGMSVLIYDTEFFGKTYLPELKNREDWGLKILLLKKVGKAYGMSDTLSVYRFRKGSLSRNKLGLIKYNVQIYRDVIGLNLFSAWIKFVFNFVPALICKKIRLKIVNSNL